jgi:hypothetical protein
MEKPVWSVTCLYFNHMKNFITIILLYGASLFTAGCFDAFSSLEYDQRLLALLPTTRTVYAGGFANSRACYWKDGEITVLGNTMNSSAVYSIILNGTDVFAAGYQSNGTCGLACYWKNGNRIDYGDGVHSSTINSLLVSGIDIYAGGYWHNGSAYVACYWKNGTKIDLGDGSNDSEVYSLALSGSDVYAGGYQLTNAGDYIACYWKNNSVTRTDLAVAGVQARVKSMLISGIYVYAGGYVGGNAYYWKNEAPYEIGTGLSNPRVETLYISGTDVYAGGHYYSASLSHEVACYWKNNSSTRTDLGLEKGSTVLSLVVSGSDVYAGGTWSNGSFTACHWVNGARSDLNNTFSYANSIYIK